MGRIGVVRLGAFQQSVGLVRRDDIRITLGIEHREPVGGAFGRSGFEVVDIAGFLLEYGQHVPHEAHRFLGECRALFGGDSDAEEVQTAFVHPVDADRREVVFPIAAETVVDVAQVEFRIGIESLFGVALDDLAFGFEAFAGQLHQVAQPFEKRLLGPRFVAESRQVDRHDADRPGQRVRREQSAAALD